MRRVEMKWYPTVFPTTLTISANDHRARIWDFHSLERFVAAMPASISDVSLSDSTSTSILLLKTKACS
nr:hypothetical protein CFP56_33330 [Quercus suber]